MQLHTNLNLIYETKALLDDVDRVVLERLYDKDIVLSKLKSISKNLLQLNAITKQFSKDLKKKKKELSYQFDRQSGQMDEVLKMSQNLLKLAENVEEELKKQNPDQRKLTKLRAKNALKINEKEFQQGWDNRLLNDVLTADMHVYFARRENWALKLLTFRFRYLDIVSHLTSLTIIFCISYLSEQVVQIIIPSIPDYIIGALLTFILAFTIEKKLKVRLANTFWKRAEVQTHLFLLHLNLYLDRVLLLINRVQEYSSGVIK